MTYYFYKFTGKVKLCQMLPGFFSRNFFFLFSDKNLLSFWGCEEIFSCSNLLSRKSAKLGRFFYNNFLFVRADIYPGGKEIKMPSYDEIIDIDWAN